jgi:hypothetical protein
LNFHKPVFTLTNKWRLTLSSPHANPTQIQKKLDPSAELFLYLDETDIGIKDSYNRSEVLSIAIRLRLFPDFVIALP